MHCDALDLFRPITWDCLVFPLDLSIGDAGMSVSPIKLLLLLAAIACATIIPQVLTRKNVGAAVFSWAVGFAYGLIVAISQISLFRYSSVALAVVILVITSGGFGFMALIVHWNHILRSVRGHKSPH